MRKLEFRGKRLDNKEWVIGSLLVDTEGHCYIVNDMKTFRTVDEVDPETVGEFTGVGNIYEGDIFNLGDKNIRYVVVWHDSGFMGKSVGAHGSFVGLEHWKARIDLIGNIHDNPDLLEAQP